MCVWVLQETELWWDDDEWGLPPDVSFTQSEDTLLRSELLLFLGSKPMRQEKIGFAAKIVVFFRGDYCVCLQP